MPLKLDVDGLLIRNCGAAIEVAHGTEIEIKGRNFEIRDCEKGIIERDPPSVLEALGLPGDTPHEYVKEVLSALLAIPEKDTDSKEKTIKASRLWGFIQNSANAMTVLQALTTLGPPIMKGMLGIF